MKELTRGAALVALVLSLGQAGNALPLPPGARHFKPSTSPLLGPPNYSTTLPGYFDSANVVAGPMASPYVPALGDLTGVVTSTVYRDPATGFLGFRYHFTSTGTSPLIRATLGGPAWKDVTITDAGANYTGASTPGTDSPAWSDGDPYFLQRDPTPSGEGVAVQWRVFNQGTSLVGPGDFSSTIFLDTMAEAFSVDDIGLLNGGAVSYARGHTPASAPIPEPGPLVLLAGGLVGFAHRKRR